MHVSIVVLLLYFVPSLTPTSREECRFFISELTPGPFGVDVKRHGPRKTDEFVEIDVSISGCPNDEKTTDTIANSRIHELILIVVQQDVYSVSDIHSQQPALIAAHHFFKLPNQVEFVTEDNVMFFTVGQNFRDMEVVFRRDLGSRAGVNWRYGVDRMSHQEVQMDKTLENGKWTYLFSPRRRRKGSSRILPYYVTFRPAFLKPQGFHHDRPLISYHLLRNDGSLDKWQLDHFRYVNSDKDLDKGANYESKQKKEKEENEKGVRRMLPNMTDWIRRNQLDAVVLLPRFQSFDEEEPLKGIPVSEAYMNLFLNSSDVSPDLTFTPHVVMYDPHSPNPISRCGRIPTTTTSYYFQQRARTPNRPNDCDDLQDPLPTFTLRQTMDLSGKPMPVPSQSHQEGSEIFDSQERRQLETLGFDVGGINWKKVDDEMREAATEMEVKVSVSDFADASEERRKENDEKDIFQYGDVESRSYLAPEEELTPIKFPIILQDILDITKPTSYMSCNVIDSLVLAREKERILEVKFMNSFDVVTSEKRSKDSIKEDTDLVFSYFTGMRSSNSENAAHHFCAVYCDRENRFARIYDSLEAICAMMEHKDAVRSICSHFYLEDKESWESVVEKVESNDLQSDSSTCALYTVHRILHLQGVDFFKGGRPPGQLEPLNLREEALRQLRLLHEQGRLFMTDSFPRFSYSTTTSISSGTPSLLSATHAPPKRKPVSNDYLVNKKARYGEDEADKSRMYPIFHANPVVKTVQDVENVFLDRKYRMKDVLMEVVQPLAESMESVSADLALLRKAVVEGKLEQYKISQRSYSDGKKKEEFKRKMKPVIDFWRTLGVSKLRLNHLLGYYEWLDAYVDQSNLKRVVFYCSICMKPEVLESLINGVHVRVPYARSGLATSGKWLEDVLTESGIDKNTLKSIWTAISDHSHQKTHINSLVRHRLRETEQLARNSVMLTSLSITASHIRTAVFMSKYNVPTMHFTALLALQMRHGAEIGVSLNSRTSATEMVSVFCEKLRLNLLYTLYTTGNSFSLMVDASTSKDSRQYFVISLRCSFDGNSFLPWFYAVEELRAETGSELFSKLSRRVDEDSALLQERGYLPDVASFSTFFWKNLISIGSDGGSPFLGNKDGLNGRVRSKKEGEAYYHSYCVSHKIDLVYKAAQSDFRNFITLLYKATYRYFGSVTNKKFVDLYRAVSVMIGNRPISIKTIYPTRWAASEHAAATALLRAWHAVLYVLRTHNYEKDNDKGRVATFRVLRYIMEDPKVLLAVANWKLILDQFMIVSKISQTDSATISYVRTLLFSLEDSLDTSKKDWDVLWEARLQDTLSEVGVEVLTSKHTWVLCSSSSISKTRLRVFGRYVDYTKMRLCSQTNSSPKTAKALRDHMIKTLGYDLGDELDDLDDTVKKVRDETTVAMRDVDVKDNNLDMNEIILYQQNADEIADKSHTTRKLMQIHDSDEEEESEDDYKTGSDTDYGHEDKVDNSKKASSKTPAILKAYRKIDWETFDPKIIVKKTREYVRNWRESTSGDDNQRIVDYHAFEFLSEPFILDVINSGGSDRVFSKSYFRPSKHSVDWFEGDLDLRRQKVDRSIDVFEDTFHLPDLRRQYNTFLSRLPSCLQSSDVQKLMDDPIHVWLYLKDNTECMNGGIQQFTSAVHYMMAIPPGTAQAERVFSMLFHTRGSRRTSMLSTTLQNHLSIRLNMHDIFSVDFDSFAEYWYSRKGKWADEESGHSHNNPLYLLKSQFFGDKIFAGVSFSDDDENYDISAANTHSSSPTSFMSPYMESAHSLITGDKQLEKSSRTHYSRSHSDEL